MSNDTETQTSQSIEERSPSRGNSSSSSSSSSSPSSTSSTTATAAQPHKQSKHKFRHEAKPVSALPPIQECTLSECIALLRLENSPTGGSPSSVVGDASGDASASQEEPMSNKRSSTPGKASSVGPSSPLDCFLTEALKNHQHRLFILKLERDFSQFLDQTSLDSMELPWINSFYRMMIHKVANCFQLERRIDTTQKTITLYRTDQSALPAFRFVDFHQEEAEEEEEEGEEETPVSTPIATTVKPIKVLKRCPPRPATVCGGRSSSSSRAEESSQRTVSIKEREEAYARARARIFQGTEVSHSRSLSSSSSNPRPQSSRSNTETEPTDETNTDETSAVVGSDNGAVMASPTSPGPSTTYQHEGSFSVHQRGRSSDTSECYPPTQPYSGHFYGDPSRRTSAPSLGSHVTHRQVVPGARHFVQGSDGVIRYDPTIDINPQQPPPRPHQGSTKASYSHQGQDQYTHPSRETYSHHPPHIQHPHPQHPHQAGHHHDLACPLVRQHSAPEVYMTKDQLMCPFVQQHLQQHHSHHHHIPHPTHLHHTPPPPQQHLYPLHHRPPPRQATYPVYGIISAPPPQTQHQGSPQQGHHGIGAYPMDHYPCSYMHHEGYSPDMGLMASGFGHHPPPPPHSHVRPLSPMHPSGGSQQNARAWTPSTRGGGSGGGSGGGGIQLPNYPVYDVDKRPPKSTELYDPKNPKCTTRKRG